MKRFVLVLFALTGCTRELQQPSMLVADDSQAVFDTVEDAPSSERVFTFTNAGSTPTAPLEVKISGDVDAFHIIGDECSGTVLKPNLRCSINLHLMSDTPGSFDGELHVAGAFVAASVVLTGKVTPAQIVITPVTSNEAEVEQGGNATLEFTVANLGGATTGALHVTALSVPFDVGGDCGGNALVGGATCTIMLTKTLAHDATVGSSSGTLEVSATPGGDDMMTAILTVTPNETLYAPAVAWGSIPTLVNESATATFSNSSATTSGPLTIKLVNLPNSSTFSIKTDNCTNKTLAPGQSCTVDLDAYAYAVGSLSGTLTASTNNLKPGVAKLSAIGVRAHWTLTVGMAGNGGGNVMVNGTDIGQQGPVTLEIPNGQSGMLTYTAAAASGSTFVGWSGTAPCTGTGACGPFVGPDGSDLTLTATFTH